MNAFQPQNIFQPQTQRQPFDPMESLGIIAGTAAESFVDIMSFGLISPDIIPEEQEQEHPWAATMGNIIGGIVGFTAPGIGSLSTTGKAIKGAQWLAKDLGFVRKAVVAAKGLSATAAVSNRAFGTIIGGGVTFGKMGVTYAVHDAACEIVRQVQEKDPSLYDIGKRAVQGGIMGGMLGFTGTAVTAEHPAVQAFAMGHTMALAETLNDIGDGQDVFSQDYITQKMSMSFLQGVVIGLFNSKGYKERRRLINSGTLESSMAYIMQDPKKNFEAGLRRMNLAIPETAKSPEFKKMLGSIKAREQRGFSGDPKKARQELGILFRKVGLDDAARHEFQKAIVDKESMKDFKNEDFMEVTKALKTTVDNMDVKINLPGFIQQFGSPSDRLFYTTGMFDIASMRNLKMAKEMEIVMGNAGREVSYALKRSVNEAFQHPDYKGAFKEGLGTRVKKAARLKPSKATEEFSRHVNYDPKEPISDRNLPPTVKLTPELEKLKETYKEITKVFVNRTNEVRKLMGLPEITPKEHYMAQLIDKPTMILEGNKAPESPVENISSRIRVAQGIKNPREMQRIEPEKIGNLRYKKDPFVALEQMIRDDLKRIYLSKPQEIAAMELKHMLATGQLTQAKYDYMANWVNIIVKGQPTPQTRNFDNYIRGKLETKPGQAVEKYFAYFGREINSPATMMSNLYGEYITKGYMGGRIRLAIRNSFQMLNTIAFVDTPSLARAMTDGMRNKKVPLFEEYKNGSTTWKMSVKQGLEHGSNKNVIDKLMFDAYTASHEGNVTVTALGSIYQAVEYVTNPKYAKLGWATAKGSTMRNKLRSQKNPDWKNALTETEKARIFMDADWTVSHVQFIYNVIGMPMITRSKVAAPIFKLASFPMNYWYKYMGETVTRLATGKPGWAKGQDIKLPWNNRLGILKHLALASAIIAGGNALGFDYSSIGGFGFLPNQKKAFIPFAAFNFGNFDKRTNSQGERLSFGERVVSGLATPEGVLVARPTVAMNAFSAMVNLFSNDRYLKQKAIRDIPKLFLPYPGMLLKEDIKRAAEKGDQVGFFVYRPYTPKKKSKAFSGIVPFSRRPIF